MLDLLIGILVLPFVLGILLIRLFWILFYKSVKFLWKMKINLLLFVVFFLFLLLLNAIFLPFHKGVKKEEGNFTYPFIFQRKEISVERFKEALRIPTISYRGAYVKENFLHFRRFLRESYPRVFTSLKEGSVAGDSFFLIWEGKDPSLLPALFMGHFDVVPASSSGWKYPPFSAKEEEGYIYARGTLDDKTGVIGLLEAIDSLLEKGFSPRRTLYFFFGDDEEIGGESARETALFWKKRNLRFFMVLDEGMAILKGVFPGVKEEITFIGIAEKGYLTLRIKAKGEGGHSSMPHKEDAMRKLFLAYRILDENPFPFRFTPPVTFMIDSLVPYTTGVLRFVFANRWILSSLILQEMGKKPSSRAAIWTTQAFTMIQSGEKENVLPREGELIVNFRLLPGDSAEKIYQRVKNLLSPISGIHVEKGLSIDPSPVSSIEGEAFQILKEVIYKVFPNKILSPALVVGATDSRHFLILSKNVYRFLPILLEKEDLSRIHGKDERISRENFYRAIEFYHYLIQRVGQ